MPYLPFFGPAIQALTKPTTKINRRRVFQGAGTLLGGGAAAALLSDAAMAQEADPSDIQGLWQSIISAKDNSFPPFGGFEIYGGSIWIASGNTDLTPAAMDSALWGAFRKIGDRTYRGVGRFWTYSPTAVWTGFGTVNQTTTLSKDGNSYHAEAAGRFYDTNGNPLGPATTLLDNGVRVG